MQHGMLSSLLLYLTLLFSTPAWSAKEMAQKEAELWLESPQLNQKVSQLMVYIENDDTDSLNFSLNRLAFPQQEVVRYLLLNELEQTNFILSSKVAMFVESQQKLSPTYVVLEKGDGYEFTVPAFNFPAISSRLIKQWKQNHSTLDFVLKAESKDLILVEWLSGSAHEVQRRETLLVDEFDSLSPAATTFLVEQLTESSVTQWLPSTQVLAHMARSSESEELYDLLWKMRADYFSQQELERLASNRSDFSLRQIMTAAGNPSLNQQALSLLTKMDPLPENVKIFLVQRMGVAEEASYVARQLAQHGHGQWVRDILSTNSSVKSSLVQQALSK
ncbi:hypothetical protein LNL84_19090 [Vibrio sp. ZSDZ34]|uniref:HEAT repeat domain-containing protein n=1 Tax=Vibrio gelatinilyticus TaxID=2893468 RepID=A0A9X2AXD9_9VIBR|nr:hypothetical protein [Vibrio gelatinilyticus]MCJ2378909.1 hypothetical protein [Vibrio gelatinilyticus]